MECLADILNNEIEILEEILNLQQIRDIIKEGLLLKPKVDELKKLIMSYFKNSDELCKFVHLHIDALDEYSEEFVLYPENKKEYERIKGKLNESIIKLIEEYFIPYCNFIDMLGIKDFNIFSFEVERIAKKEIEQIEKCLRELDKKLKEVRNGNNSTC